MHEVRLQELELDRTLDLGLFSESFQYIPVAAALDKVEELTHPGGHLLVCDVFADMLQSLALPIGNVVSTYARGNYPLSSRFLAWKFRKRLQKVERRYFSGEIHAKAFRQWKSYRLMLFERT